jgi:hypothetical protein
VCDGCLSSFSLTTLLSIKDVPGDAQTHLEAAHTHVGSCNAQFGRCPLQDHTVHNMGPKCVWAASMFFETKIDRDKERLFVLSATTTMGTDYVARPPLPPPQ